MFDPVLNVKIAVKDTVEKLLGGDLNLVFAILAYLYRHCYTMRNPSECTVDAIRNGIRLMTGRSVTDAYIRQILSKMLNIGIVENTETRLQDGNVLRKVHVWRPKPFKEVYDRLTQVFEDIKKGTEIALNEIIEKLKQATQY